MFLVMVKFQLLNLTKKTMSLLREKTKFYTPLSRYLK